MNFKNLPVLTLQTFEMDNIPCTSFTVMKYLENVPLREKTMQDSGYSIPVSGTCEPSSVD